MNSRSMGSTIVVAFLAVVVIIPAVENISQGEFFEPQIGPTACTANITTYGKDSSTYNTDWICKWHVNYTCSSGIDILCGICCTTVFSSSTDGVLYNDFAVDSATGFGLSCGNSYTTPVTSTLAAGSMTTGTYYRMQFWTKSGAADCSDTQSNGIYVGQYITVGT
jgi:hypothetical protein